MGPRVLSGGARSRAGVGTGDSLVRPGAVLAHSRRTDLRTAPRGPDACQRRADHPAAAPGTETVDVAEITEIFPPAEYEDGEYEPKKWETARVLGELSGVPRKRHGIGLRLVGGGLVQAWAKDDDGLRAALETAKQEYV